MSQAVEKFSKEHTIFNAAIAVLLHSNYIKSNINTGKIGWIGLRWGFKPSSGIKDKNPIKKMFL